MEGFLDAFDREYGKDEAEKEMKESVKS